MKKFTVRVSTHEYSHSQSPWGMMLRVPREDLGEVAYCEIEVMARDQEAALRHVKDGMLLGGPNCTFSVT